MHHQLKIWLHDEVTQALRTGWPKIKVEPLPLRRLVLCPNEDFEKDIRNGDHRQISAMSNCILQNKKQHNDQDKMINVRCCNMVLFL